MDCLPCQKHKGQVAPPPGGYIYKDSYWLVPRRNEDGGRGLPFRAKDITCEQLQVEELATQLLARLMEA